MGLFRRKPARVPDEPDDETAAAIVSFTAALMEDVERGPFPTLNDVEHSRSEIEMALSMITAYAFGSEDVRLLKLLKRIAICYAVDEEDELDDASLGRMTFENLAAVMEYRHQLLAEHQPGLERALSAFAVGQTEALRASSRNDAVVNAFLSYSKEESAKRKA